MNIIRVSKLKFRVDEKVRHGVLSRHRLLMFFLLIAFAVFVLPLPVQAAIIVVGDVTANPSSWTSSTDAYIGNTFDGILTSDEGIVLASGNAYLGYQSGVNGEVDLEGIGTIWNNHSDMYVGYSGNGILNIAGGAAVNTGHDTFVASQPGSAGAIHFGAGGTLTTGTLYASPSQLSGTGTINTSGIVSDIDLVFDSTHGVNQSFSINGITVNLTQYNYYGLGAGYMGNGSLTIRDGMNISSRESNLGLRSGSVGVANVIGAGSRWETSSLLYIGKYGSGTLNINSGGTVHSVGGDIGSEAGSEGVVNVAGAGSMWDSYWSEMFVGNYGKGTLNISGGATVTSIGITVAGNSGSSGSINFGSGGGTVTTDFLRASPSQLTGSGTINTKGLVSDINLVFDATHGLTQSFMINSISINLAQSNDKCLGVGYVSSGSLTIRHGKQISSGDAYLGYKSGSSGVATVQGAASVWHSSYICVGLSGSGTLNILEGATVSGDKEFSLGCNVGSSGTVNVDGTGSTMTTNSDLNIGASGQGTLNISGGAGVTVNGSTYVARLPGSTGSINFGAGGGTLMTQSLFAAPSQLTGTGTINTNGLVTDLDLAFDSTHDLSQTLHLNNILVNLSQNASGDLCAGYSGLGSLAIQDGKSVSAKGGYIGYYPGSTGIAAVAGSGSTWSLNSDLYVGKSGDGTLNISGGGKVATSFPGDCYVGYDSGSTGKVTVDGAGSAIALGNLNFYAGYSGDGTLSITNGGTVSDSATYIGTNKGSKGAVQVDGAGSSLTASYTVIVGSSDGIGTLDVTHGGLVSSSFVDIDGTATVDGAGSKLVTTYLDVGTSVGNGKLFITGGANASSNYSMIGADAGSTGFVKVDASGWRTSSLQVGYNGNGTLNASNGSVLSSLSTSNSNSIGHASGTVGIMTLDGPGSIWNNSNNLFIGESGSGTLTVSNGAVISCASTANASAIGYNAGSVGVFNIDGAGSSWSSKSDLYVGKSGSGTLNISGSATVAVTGTTAVAFDPGSTGSINFGAGSGTLTSGSLIVGASQLSGTGTIITSGLVSDVDLLFDATHGTTQSFAIGDVTVAFSQSAANDLGVAYAGNGSLTIRDGKQITDRNGYLGFKSGSTGVATVDGADSKWTNSSSFHIGVSGSGTLNISGTGVVSSVSSYVADFAGSTGEVNISGVGSKWATDPTTNTTLYVAQGGTGKVNITSGGAVTAGSCILGNNAGAAGTLTVDGGVSAFTNSAAILIGNSGSGTLNITGSASVVSKGAAVIGANAGSTGSVTVDGTSSKWSNMTELDVGKSGSGTLNIQGGGLVSVSGPTYVACNAGSSGAINFGPGGGTLTTTMLLVSPSQLMGTGTINATGIISDIDLTFDATHNSTQSFPINNITVNLAQSSTMNLGAGYYGNGTLTIRDGKQISSKIGYLGFNSGSNGSATVMGANSKWTNSSDIYLGNNGNGTLNIQSGGIVANAGSYLAYSPGTSGIANVDGANSKWTSSSTAWIGYAGNGTVNVTGGAFMSSLTCRMGGKTGSSGSVNVSGTNSRWNNGDFLYIGYLGNGTLNISNGGTVNCTYGNFGRPLEIGYSSGSTGIVTVDGAGSTLNSQVDFYVGDSGTGTLIISGGGAVSVNGVTYVTPQTYASSIGTGMIKFGAGGGTLTTTSLLAASNQLQGAGTINATGVVSDIDLKFDATHGLTQSFPINNITFNLSQGTTAYLGAGYAAAGSLAIRDGKQITCSAGYLGYKPDASGVAALDGAGSSWTVTSNLNVGYYGNGSLTITNGATLSTSQSYVAYGSWSTGSLSIDGLGSKCTCSSALYVGYGFGSYATMNITNGAVVQSGAQYSSKYSEIGKSSTGVVNVDGAGSKWDNSYSSLYIGDYGSGTLNITHGGTVISMSSNIGYVGSNSGSMVRVDGIGSTWTNTGEIYMGTNSGTGSLYVTGGGTVTAYDIGISSTSLFELDVGSGSKVVTNPAGIFNNYGTFRIIGAPAAKPGDVYTPIAAAIWQGNGVYQAIGGKWDAVNHAFTVSVVQHGISGVPATIDRATTQRLEIVDNLSSWKLDIGVAATAVSSPMMLTATTIDDEALASLNGILSPGHELLGGWTITWGNGYTEGDPLYLSFAVETKTGYDSNVIQLWSYDGTQWSPYSVKDLTYDGNFASFTATHTGCYAVTVPEPSTFILLGFGAVSLFLSTTRWRKRGA